MKRWSVSLIAVFLASLSVGRPAIAGERVEVKKTDFASAAIVLGQKADDLERLAAREVQRYLCRISGKLLPLAGPEIWRAEPNRPLILVGTPQSHSLLAAWPGRASSRLTPPHSAIRASWSRHARSTAIRW